ncbi:MAG: hypothetical protein R3F02_16935 [Thiolinea sp.]
MYRLISAISSNYGPRSYNRDNDYISRQGFLGVPNSYFSNFYQTGIQTLLLILVQQQLRDILGQPGQTEDQTQNQTGSTSSQVGMPSCPPHTEQTEQLSPLPPPLTEEEEQKESENKYSMIIDSILQLQQLLAQHNISQSFASYSDDLVRNMEDQRVIQSVYMNGGRIIDTTEHFFVAEDSEQVRYIIER